MVRAALATNSPAGEIAPKQIRNGKNCFSRFTSAICASFTIFTLFASPRLRVDGATLRFGCKHVNTQSVNTEKKCKPAPYRKRYSTTIQDFTYVELRLYGASENLTGEGYFVEG